MNKSADRRHQHHDWGIGHDEATGKDYAMCMVYGCRAQGDYVTECPECHHEIVVTESQLDDYNAAVDGVIATLNRKRNELSSYGQQLAAKGGRVHPSVERVILNGGGWPAGVPIPEPLSLIEEIKRWFRRA